MYKIVCGFVFIWMCLIVLAPAGVMASETSSQFTGSTTVHTPIQIETKVRADFADIPVMIDIARCESKFRQFTDAGNVFRGGAGNQMIGVFQFYESIHKASALALGFDMATVEGNLGYARHLYQAQGTTPWRECVPTTPTTDANLELRLNLMRQLIGLLQQLLALKQAERQ